MPAHKNIEGNGITDLEAKTTHNISEPFNITKDISNIVKEVRNRLLKEIGNNT